jgi:hypothetical protein
MKRTWWHSLIITGSVLLIFGMGVAAIWGPDLRGWFDSATQNDSATPPASQPAGPGSVL